MNATLPSKKLQQSVLQTVGEPVDMLQAIAGFLALASPQTRKCTPMPADNAKAG